MKKVRSGARRVGVGLVAASLLGMLAGVQPARAAVQTVSGTIQHPAATGAVARNAWVASAGAVNGISGYVFAVDPATVGQRFIVRTSGPAADWTDTNITFYSSYTATGGTVCANYTFLNPAEAGRACGVLAAVWSFSGGPVDFTYTAGDGVAWGGVVESSGPIAHAGNVDFTTGTDLAFEGNYAYIGSEDPSPLEGGLHIVDISNPTSPVEVGHLACPAVQNDVAVWRGIVTMAIDSASSNRVCTPGTGAQGVRVVDARIPTNPAQIEFFDNVAGGALGPNGAHTVTTVGDTGYVYANNYWTVSDNAVATITVIDLRPVLTGGKPVVAGNVEGLPQAGCHDITVSGNRAYCAAITHSEIWDISNPLDPVVLGVIANPLINIHHSTAVDGNILVIGDEFTGAEAAFGCSLGGNGPFGRLWFYDITNPALPVPLGSFQVPEVYPGVRYTAHNFNIIPGRNLLVAAWYKGGTRVIDFSDPANPVQVAYARADGAITWSAYWYNGAIYTGDMHRGMDVFTLAI